MSLLWEIKLLLYITVIFFDTFLKNIVSQNITNYLCCLFNTAFFPVVNKGANHFGGDCSHNIHKEKNCYCQRTCRCVHSPL
uniref:Uncharacterized protein n=1 Tax=Anguilla anguilla TaxID=7936 RepID=A0A0E9V1G4_ANGAN